ncbi:hypothetical protein [uncultured Tateyamaria sp.]|uniref:hypothetical protein n=1 Tax=uncultured Tateyamaria sp. TaxID=455651 RepID=UPI002624A20E|nr:hypothetical protein [uncultured Tateyamaria sp.]
MPRTWVAIYAVLVLLLIGVVMQRNGAPLWGLGVAGVLAIGAFYYLLSGIAVVAIFLRALLALVPITAVSGALIYWVITKSGLEAGEQRALVAAIAVAAGWVVAFVTGEMRVVNQEQERRRDIIRAALAEIDLIVDWAAPIDWAAAISDMQQNFFKNRSYKVFVFYGHQFETLRRLTAQIEILSKPQIMPVTEFYQLLDRLEQMETKMGATEFDALPWDRREKAVTRYLELQGKVAGAGKIAAAALRNRPFHGWIRHIT